MIETWGFYYRLTNWFTFGENKEDAYQRAKRVYSGIPSLEEMDYVESGECLEHEDD